MRIVSANLNQRLGKTSIRARVDEWLGVHSPDVFVSQEPFAPASAVRPDLAGYTLMATSPLTSCWISDRYAGVTVIRVSDRWQKILVAGLTIHNLYLSPDSAKDRREMLRQIEEEIVAAGRGPAILLGDFNLAPHLEDGIFGAGPSTFTSAGERKALASLLASGGLFDATCPTNGQPVVFTFERLSKGKPCNFRCDLALISESIRSCVTVTYDHSVRKSPGAFTDHSAVIVDVAGVSIQRSVVEPVARQTTGAARQRGNISPTAQIIASASHKTAIRRTEASQIARNLIAQGVLAELGTKSILDYGCAYGVDVEFYRGNGFAADGYDVEPRFGMAQLPTELYDLVTVVYVVNVLPTIEDRLDAIRSAAQKVQRGGYILVTARSDSAIAKEAARGKWQPFNDGWISSPGKGTFQKGIRQVELAWLLGAVGMEPCPCRLRCSSEVAWMLGKKSPSALKGTGRLPVDRLTIPPKR
jgi:exonuclease III